MRRELKGSPEAQVPPHPAAVSAVVPMRRELKATFRVTSWGGDLGFSSCPDEEGTERKVLCGSCWLRRLFQQLSR